MTHGRGDTIAVVGEGEALNRTKVKLSKGLAKAKGLTRWGKVKGPKKVK